MPPSESTAFGRNFALVIGLGFLGLAAYAAATRSGPLEVALPTIIGGSALAGWARALRRSRDQPSQD